MISSTSTKVSYAGPTSAGATYNIPFPFYSDTDLKVIRRDTSTSPATEAVLVEGTMADYQMTGVDLTNGIPGTGIILTAALTGTQTLVIRRNLPRTQNTNLTDTGPYQGSGTMNALDRSVLIEQELDERLSRRPAFAESSPTANIGLPEPIANTVFSWDSTGTKIQYTPVGNLITLQALSPGYIYVGNASGQPGLFPMTGDVSISNAGFTTVNTVGGATAASIAAAAAGATAASSSNTPNTIVKRDASGNFSAGSITASLSGNVAGNLTGNVTGNVSGSAASITGINPIANGGTGQSTQQAAMDALAGTQSTGKYLRSNGTHTTLQSIQAADVPTLNQNTTGTAANVTGTVPIPNGGTGQTSFASGVLKSNGSVLSSSPITDSDISSSAGIAISKLGQSGASTGQGLTWSGTAWVPGTGGSGQGAKNYISNYNFETNATTGWNLLHTGLTGTTPITARAAGSAFASFSQSCTFNGTTTVTTGSTTGLSVGMTLTNAQLTGSVTITSITNSTTFVINQNGAGATGAITTTFNNTTVGTGYTLSVNSTNPLAGSYSLSLAASGASSAGDMLISQACTIDIEDQAKVLGFKFYYQLATDPGTANRNFSGTSSNTWAIWIYDVTNGQWIQPAGVYNLVQSSGVGIATGTFQTPSNMTQFQIAVVNINATGGAMTMLFDDFMVGPQTTSIAPAMSDWQGYTPTFQGFGTPTGVECQWRCVGDSVEIRGKFFAGTSTAVEARIGLPPNLTSADTTKIPSIQVCGTGAYSVAQAQQITMLIEPSVTYLTTGFQATSVIGLSKLNGSSQLSSGQGMSFFARLPIRGWSSNTASSADSDGRVCGANYVGQPTGTLNSAFNTITFPTLVKDTHAAYGSGTYTVPSSGLYNLVAGADITGTFTANQYAAVAIFINGVEKYTDYVYTGSSSNNELQPTVVANSVPLNAGDLITIRARCSGTSPVFTSSSTTNSFSIAKQGGQAVVQATQVISFSGTKGSTQSVTANTTDITFSSAKDSHGVWTGSGYPCPSSGDYVVSCALADNGSNTNVFSAYVNGTLTRQVACGVTGNWGSGSTILPNLKAGDVISLRTATTTTISSAGNLSIFRLGGQG